MVKGRKHMKAKKFTPAMRGLAALMTCLMVLSIVGTGVANTYRGALDDTLGTESYVTINDNSAARFKTDYATIEDMRLRNWASVRVLNTSTPGCSSEVISITGIT